MSTSRMTAALRATRGRLKTTSVLPMALGVGFAAAGLGAAICYVRPAKAEPSAHSATSDGLLPEAVPRPVRMAAACNPCAADPC